MSGFIRYRDVFTFQNLEAFDNWIDAHNQTWRQARDSSQHLNSIYYKCVLIVFRQFFNI